MKNQNRVLGGILLVSGTTIGAGMLALPIVTGMAGFIPSTLLFIGYWIYMAFTAFLMLEVNLWTEGHTNLMTMAKRTLGRGGTIFSWIVYLFLLYTLTTAYIAGSGPIFIDFIHAITGVQLPLWTGPFPLLVIFGFFVYQGTKSVDYLNRLLMLGLAISYVLLIVFLSSHVEGPLLEHIDWKYLGIGVSVVSTSFGFHIIIPTLTQYLERDVKQLRQVILIGSLIPLVIYISWELLALGIIPLENLVEGYRQGSNAASLLSSLLKRGDLAMISRFFSLFAIVTSFLGVSLSLTDFLADGLKIRRTRKGRMLLYGLTFLPPLAITLTDPRAFLHALEYAGAFGVVLLLGILPVAMVWSGRYYQHRDSTAFKAPGGKGALIAAALVSLFVMGLEVANKLSLLPNPF